VAVALIIALMPAEECEQLRSTVFELTTAGAPHSAQANVIGLACFMFR
jgi:hypothetical protein